MLKNGAEVRGQSTGEHVRSVPDRTLEALARSIHKEGLSYGLSRLDFIRFVNLLLDRVLKPDEVAEAQSPPTPRREGQATTDRSPERLSGLPCGEGRIWLRQFDVQSDRELFEHWLADPHGRYFLLSGLPATLESYSDFLARNAERIAIVTRADRTPIGAMAFLHHDQIHRRAELRKLIGNPADRGQGYAREAARLWIRFGFEVLGLRKIYLDTLDTNLRNIRLNESLGFVVEGILRNEFVLDGQERDVLRMGLCRPTEQDVKSSDADDPRIYRS
jgi:diamine N-acetyltransferase